MTHSFPDFTAHVIALLRKTGPSGPAGPIPANPLISQEKGGTTRAIEVGPVDFDRSQLCALTGPGRSTANQSLTNAGTTGTSGTTNFEEGRAARTFEDNPAGWHAISEELKRLPAPEWVGVDRWLEMIEDADAFLSDWSGAAHDLGWTALNLFGVHAVAPGARYDVMGLVPLLRSRRVSALAERTAVIRQCSGATLTYTRRETTGAVLFCGGHYAII